MSPPSCLKLCGAILARFRPSIISVSHRRYFSITCFFPTRRLSKESSASRRAMASLNESELAHFSRALSAASKITVLTGAGISAESGIPTFRGAGGLWRTWSATELATPEAFAADPSLVWEFYHYRRLVVSNAMPNLGHYAIAALQQRCQREGKLFTLLTQNIDGLHWEAGSKDVVELHGSLWKTRCRSCENVEENFDMPICAALDGKGAPDTKTDARIPVAQLPHCKKCNGLLRPHVVWFGEMLDPDILARSYDSLRHCDVLLVVGTSAVVQPAAGFAPIVKGGGGIVAEFNLEDTPISRTCSFKFYGPSGETLPRALNFKKEELSANIRRGQL